MANEQPIAKPTREPIPNFYLYGLERFAHLYHSGLTRVTFTKCAIKASEQGYSSHGDFYLVKIGKHFVIIYGIEYYVYELYEKFQIYAPCNKFITYTGRYSGFDFKNLDRDFCATECSPTTTISDAIKGVYDFMLCDTIKKAIRLEQAMYKR